MRVFLTITAILLCTSCGSTGNKSGDATTGDVENPDHPIDAGSDTRATTVADTRTTTSTTNTDTGTYNVDTGPCGSTGQVCCGGDWCLGFATCVSGTCEGETGASTDTGAADTHQVDSTPYDTAVTDTHIPDTPAIDTTFSDTLATETPATDSTVADTPATDTAVADTPATDTAVADTPATDTAVADTPATDTAVADTVTTDTLATDSTVADTVTTDTPADTGCGGSGQACCFAEGGGYCNSGSCNYVADGGQACP